VAVAALCCCVLTLSAALTASSGSIAAAGEPAPAQQPNIVVIMTDDQDAASVGAMANVQTLLADQGTTFSNSFASFPLCCPSRATFLTGQYAHNHGVLDNAAPNGGFAKLDSSNTLPVWLQSAGYYTAHIGKYLNGYELQPSTIPAGWTEWRGSTVTYRFYGYQLNEMGTLVDYGTAPTDYQTDVYAAKAAELIGRRAPAAEPFFLSFAPLAPHSGGPNPNPQPPTDCGGTAKPAPRHATAFDGAPLPQPPSFDEADVSDKPAHIQARAPFASNDITRITRNYRCRLESLLAVDEAVGRIITALRDSGELENTYVVFTSDNGFFHGEHRIAAGKVHVYEESIRVPLIIRGPGIPAGSVSDELVVNADLAPTIVDATGAPPGLTMDGRSLLPIAADPDRRRGRALLFETGPATPQNYAAVRTHRYKYVEYATGDRELYDLAIDPYELDNRHADPAYADIVRRLAGRLAVLRSCAGASCRQGPNLDLVLKHPNPARRGACAPHPIQARITGPASRDAAVVEFAVAGKLVRTDRRAPFEDRLPKSRFRPRGKTAIGATVHLIDGREMTLERRVRACD
jgi:arylsulfatase A-like enzyme